MLDMTYSPNSFLFTSSSPPHHWSTWLAGKLVADDLSALNLHLLVKPLPVAAALHTTLAGAAVWARVEAAHAFGVQAVAEVTPARDQQPSAVIHFTLPRHGLPEETH